MTLDSISAAVEALRAGRIVIVVDDERRENEGDFIVAAQHVTPEHMATFLEHTSGFVCVATTNERADALDLPLMVDTNTESQLTAFTVTVDAAVGTSTGISAKDRAATIRVLADPGATHDMLRRPGHVHVLRAKDGGVVERPGHTEAGVDLMRMAGLEPAAVICEVVTADKLDMARLPELRLLADELDMALVSIADLVEHRHQGLEIDLTEAGVRPPG